MRASMTFAAAAVCLGLTTFVAIPVATGQDKPAESGALDPRLKPLIGTWEGRVQFRSSRDEEGRTLVIQEKAGQLEGRFGIAGKNLAPVVLSVEADGSRPKVRFTTSTGNTVALELIKEDWLSGVMVLTGGSRGSGSPDNLMATAAATRPMELQRKK